MNYTLALRLKKAGFPMKLADATSKTEDVFYFTGNDGVAYLYPTLSEIIEACGDRFEWLTVDDIQINDKYGLLTATKKEKNGWLCGDKHVTQDEDAGLRIHGSTPDEAVSHLWLALNEEIETNEKSI